jgi:hypothetical protein
MKIAVTSDLHYDITPQNHSLVPYIVDEVKRQSPDALVLGGDLANTLAGWGEVLGNFRPLQILKLVVPGNHDVWIESKSALNRGQDSTWKYDIALREIAAQHGFQYLPGNPIIIGRIGFTGSLGWYDYSLRDPRLDGAIGQHEYEKGTLTNGNGYTLVWNDTRRAAWLRYPHSEDWRRRRLRLSAWEVCTKLAKSLEAECQSLAGRISNLVAVIHTNPFRSCISPAITPDPFDAYEGSVRLGELLVRFGAHHDILCICGHRHKRLDINEAGIRVVRSPVGYLDHFNGDYGTLATEVVRVLEI